jgi:hypothetical protein
MSAPPRGDTTAVSPGSARARPAIEAAVTGSGSRKRKATTSDVSDATANCSELGGASSEISGALSSSAAVDSHAALRSLLECTVCYSVMLPPIRQCDDGHNFCDRCSNKLMTSPHDSARKCPMCRIKLRSPVARARNLERWAAESGIEVVCEFAPCCERSQYGQHAEHKFRCLGQTIGCPLRCCSWRGEPSALAKHLVGAGGALHSPPSHGLEELGARYSARHSDYSTTTVFSTKRPPDDRRRWRPPRQLITIPPNSALGTPALSFCVALWKPRGKGQPILAAIQALRTAHVGQSTGAVGYSYDLSISAYPRPPFTRCVSRVSSVGSVPELGCDDVWARPRLARVCGPVLVADRSAATMFTTVGLGPLHSEAVQRYEVHVRLTPLTDERAPMLPHAAGAQMGGAAEARLAYGHRHGGGDEDEGVAEWARRSALFAARQRAEDEDEDEEEEDEDEEDEEDYDNEDDEDDEDDEDNEEEDEDDEDEEDEDEDEDEDEEEEDDSESESSVSSSSSSVSFRSTSVSSELTSEFSSQSSIDLS